MAASTSAVARLAIGPASARANCPTPWLAILLALGVGVGKQAADGQQENGAQAKAEPCGDQQPGNFAHDDGGHQNEEQAEAAPPAVGSAEAETHHGQQREKGMDAQFDAHPAAQRN